MEKEIKRLEERNEELEKNIERLYKERSSNIEKLFNEDEAKAIEMMNDSNWFIQNVKPLTEEQRKNENQILILKRLNVKVGDGVTIHLYTDSHAYTIIKRTAKTITIQRDKATLKPEFKPEFIPGGFAAHCINQDEQSYNYEKDLNGETLTLHWSNKYNCWLDPYGKGAMLGRHEFYDYNF